LRVVHQNNKPFATETVDSSDPGGFHLKAAHSFFFLDLIGRILARQDKYFRI
jgi:hypothetical protein